ncbi:hypothetical protein BRD15_07865 [Halobacteriales archaeon SW_6_65_15]|nr:MAG: hypothetical protein BRD15_07865 [Halobacteriales archaeon SW_6_65_15]
MGEFADAVAVRLRDALAERQPNLDWETEYRIGRTPVDVVGASDDLFVAVELEWRRADPADNTAKLFRHLAEGGFAASDEICVCQVFTGYYDLQSGGVSSKRENAEFVGSVAEDAFDRFRYRPVRFDLTPPKRGGERPEGWRTRADETADEIASLL